MLSVNSVDDSRNGVSMVDKLRENQLSQDSFMKLLLTQLKMQSPLNPFDSSTMMQQISQLTALSATQELEKTVKDLNMNMGTSQVLEASQLVGKKIQVPSGISPLVQGEELKSSVIVPKGVENITVTIKDSNDKIVKTINLKATDSGVLDFAWDGLDAENNPMTPGFYKISASTVINGESTALATTGTFKVNSVALDKNGKGVILNLDGLGGVHMSDVIKIL